MNQHQNLMPIAEASGLYVDALLCDHAYLRFISVWGRDTEMQAFLARLSLPLKEGGLDAIRVDEEYVQIGNIERFEKLTGRMPKENIFGEVTHCGSSIALPTRPTIRVARRCFSSSRRRIRLRIVSHSMNGSGPRSARPVTCRCCHSGGMSCWRDS